MIDNMCQSDNPSSRREQLLRYNITPTNYLGISLTVAPLRRKLTFNREKTSEEEKCALFITLHTVRPSNRINLKHVSQLDEIYVLAKYALNMKHDVLRKFFEKHFPSETYKLTLKQNPFDKIKLYSISSKEDVQFNRVELEVDESELSYRASMSDVEDIFGEHVKNISYDELEQLPSYYLNKWEHFVLFKTKSVYFVLSVTKHGSFVFGFTLGGTPKNYLKLKEYARLNHVLKIINAFKYLLSDHYNKHLEEGIIQYQEKIFRTC